MGDLTFSQTVKNDLLRVSCKTQEEIYAEVMTAFFCGGRRTSPDGVPDYLSVHSAAYAERLVAFLRQIRLDALAEKTAGTIATWRIYPLGKAAETFESVYSHFFSPSVLDEITSSVHGRRAALRGAFLISGSMNDPTKSYRIEMTVHNKEAADFLVLLLHAEDILSSVSQRNSRITVYFKEGQQIADFLALIGAHSSLIRLESIRVDKELRNSVNRMVNCDSGNSQRQAEACARQTENLLALLRHPKAVSIPQELIEAARVRIDNPGFSIKEIGEMMNPPLGKSGMNHRLTKLDEFVRMYVTDADLHAGDT